MVKSVKGADVMAAIIIVLGKPFSLLDRQSQYWDVSIGIFMERGVGMTETGHVLHLYHAD